MNDDPNNGDQDYLKSTSAAVTDFVVNLGTVSFNGASVSSVVVNMWCRRTVSQAVAVRTLIKTHGILYAGASNFNCPNSGTYGTTSTTYATNPNTGAAWTQAEIDALQAGCRDNDATTREVRCTEVRVDVNFNLRYALEVRFAWSGVSLVGDQWILNVTCQQLVKSMQTSETVLVQVGQGGNPPSSWITAYTCNSDNDQTFTSYALSATELNLGAPVVRVWDNQQGAVDTVQRTMALNVFKIDRIEYRTGFNSWYYYIDRTVDSDTGNLYLPSRDLTVKALGWNLEIVRAYNSGLAGNDGLMGFGWTFTYDTRIIEATTGIANWYDPTGGVHTFRLYNGGWVAPPGIDANLTKSTTFTLRFKDGSKDTFNSIGRLATMVDKSGNTLTLTWTQLAPIELTTVADGSGLQLNFTYRVVGPSARIATIQDPIARQVKYVYDGSGNMISMTDAMGNATYYTYDSSHRLQTIRDPVPSNVQPPPAVRKITYQYDPAGRVAQIKYASINSQTNATIYEYVAYGLNYVVATYPGADHAVNATNAKSIITTVNVDSAGSPLQVSGPQCGACASLVQNPTNGQTSCGCGGGCGCAGGNCGGGNAITEVLTLSWDSNRNLLTKKDKLNHQYSFTYDGVRNLLNATDPLGNVTRNVWVTAKNATAYISTLNQTTNARGFTTYYTYDTKGNLKQTKDPTNNISKRDYNAQGYMTKSTDWRGFNTTFAYDSHGYLLNRTDATGNQTIFLNDGVGRLARMTMPDSHAWQTQYDKDDRIVKRIDPLNNATTYTYDAISETVSRKDQLGRVTQYAWNVTNRQIAQALDALGNSTAYVYDLVGNLVKVTNPRGFNTTFSYDNFNRKTVVTDALGNQTVTTYDGDGLVTALRNRRGFYTNSTYDALYRLLTIRDALGNVTTFSYDQVGNPITVKNARGFTTTYTYDVLNRRTRVTDALGNVTRYAYDANGNLVNTTDPNGNSNVATYDRLNRKISARDGESKTTIYSYDSESNLVQARDANSKLTNYSFDPLNRVKLITDANGNTTKFDYDATGNMLNVTDANGHKTVQQFDGLNRLTKITTPLGKITRYTYDANGNMRTRTDPKGNMTTYTFDRLDRLVRIDYPDSTFLTATYDAEGNTQTASGFGFTRTDVHDALNRFTSISFNFGSFSKVVSYTYDQVGNRKTITYPEGQTISYSWDALNRLTSLQDSAVGSWTFVFDAGSRRTKLTYPSNMVTTYSYDRADRVTKIETKTSGGSILERLNYTYDNIGNRLSVVEQNGNTSTYGYDNVYRLKYETYTGGLIINYTYDGVGNRLTEVRNSVTTSYSYDADNRLASRGATVYSYDANGNLTSETAPGPSTTTYRYDLENRVTNVTLPSGTVESFQYSAQHKRVSLSVNSVTTYLMYDSYDFSGFDDRIADYAANGSLLARYIHGPGVDEPFALVRGSTYFYLENAIGSITSLTTTSQSITANYQYEAFGSLRASSGSVSNPYLFTGRELDSTSGLYYYRERWYHPIVGRFLTADPWRFEAGPNFYVYVRDNPVNRNDPTGFGPWGGCGPVPCMDGAGGGGPGSDIVKTCSDCKTKCSQNAYTCVPCGGQTQDPACPPGDCKQYSQQKYSDCCERYCRPIPVCNCYT